MEIEQVNDSPFFTESGVGGRPGKPVRWGPWRRSKRAGGGREYRLFDNPIEHM